MESGCGFCAKNRKKTKEEYIESIPFEHREKYDYSKLIFISTHKKGIVICKKCSNTFEQNLSNHREGNGCPLCNEVRLTKEQFIKNAQKVRGNRYDYSKFDYINAYTPGIIICSIHGEFEQNSRNHIHNKQDCPECMENSTSSKKEKEWLNFCNVPDNKDHRQVKIWVNKNTKKYYKVDGYIPETKTIYEFFGNYYHRKPKKIFTRTN